MPENGKKTYSEKIRMSFAITGNFSPSHVSELLAAEPSWYIEKGEKVLHAKFSNPCVNHYPAPWSVWGIKSEENIVSEDLSDHISYLLNFLEPRARQINSLYKSNCHGSFNFSLNFPCMGSEIVNRRQLFRLCELSHFLDFDFHCSNAPHPWDLNPSPSYLEYTREEAEERSIMNFHARLSVQKGDSQLDAEECLGFDPVSGGRIVTADEHVSEYIDPLLVRAAHQADLIAWLRGQGLRIAFNLAWDVDYVVGSPLSGYMLRKNTIMKMLDLCDDVELAFQCECRCR